MSSSPWQPQSPPPKRNPRRLVPALLAVVAVVAVVGGLYALALVYGQRSGPNQAQPSPTAEARNPTPQPTAAQRVPGLGGPQVPLVTPSPTAISSTLAPAPVDPALASLRTLDSAQVPARDPYALAARLKFKDGRQVERTSGRPPGNYRVGHKDTFNVSDLENRNYYTITATVRKVTEHAYWYAQDGRTVDQAAIDNLANTFESEIYPTNRALFGSEWNPGVDNDPHITVLFAPLRGAGGSYSAADEYTRSVNPFSNEREMIYISTGGGWNGLESTLAHEFQHMIHWHEHPNQDIWLNEGASVLASALNGYSVLGVDTDFMRNPDVQLNAWQSSPGLARPNYGAAFLFLDYLRTHYKQSGAQPNKIISSVITAPESGVGAVDTALASTGSPDRFVDAFKKWTLANLLDGQPGARPEWSYPDRDVQVSPQVVLDDYPTGHSGQVSQFGADYVQINAPQAVSETLQVDFAGAREVGAIPAPAHGGSAIWWSNRGDLANTSMTRRFDLTDLSSATLDCYLWFDIEQDFDYAYAEASTDGGATWDTLRGKYTTATNPNGNSYGNAYTGKSKDVPGADPNGWLHERFNLDAYAGKEVMLRFEYVTDDGYNAQGLAVDDISVPELSYNDDAEGGSERANYGWQGDGFVRIDNKLPQRYYLAVVKYGKSGVEVQPVDVDASGEAGFRIEGLGTGGPYSKAVLVIAGLTDHNIQRPTFELSVRPAK